MTENDAQVLRTLHDTQCHYVGEWVNTRQILASLPEGYKVEKLAKVLAKLERHGYVWRRIVVTTDPVKHGTFAGIGSMRRRVAKYQISPLRPFASLHLED